jgi:hypothetical protein
MTRRPLFAFALLVLPATWVACSDDGAKETSEPSTKDGGSGGGSTDDDASTGGGAASGGAGTGGAGTGGGAATGGAGPALDCTKDNWSNLSDGCWACMCDACEATLDACNETCTDVFECTLEKDTLVDNLPDIGCEVRASAAECFTAPGALAVVNQLIGFDTCLIGAPKPDGGSGFRVCEKECDVIYSGDVCDRYPPPPAPDQ